MLLIFLTSYGKISGNSPSRRSPMKFRALGFEHWRFNNSTKKGLNQFRWLQFRKRYMFLSRILNIIVFRTNLHLDLFDVFRKTCLPLYLPYLFIWNSTWRLRLCITQHNMSQSPLSPFRKWPNLLRPEQTKISQTKGRLIPQIQKL